MSDLQNLWQSDAPPIDTDKLIARLRRQNQVLRRINIISFAVCIIAVILVLILEFWGRLPTRGLLSLGSVIGLGWNFWKYKRDRAKLIAAYSEEPDRLLPFLIDRTRKARNLGRYFYMMPAPSLFIGYLLGAILDRPSAPEPASDGILILILVPAMLFMIAITVFGLRLARTKSAQLKELKTLWRQWQSGEV